MYLKSTLGFMFSIFEKIFSDYPYLQNIFRFFTSIFDFIKIVEIVLLSTLIFLLILGKTEFLKRLYL